MCIILAKPKGVPLPDNKYLEECFRVNKDGFGLAYTDGDTVKIRKGAMNIGDMHKLIRRCPNLTDRTALLHWRIATKGSVCPQNCHPFPLSSKTKALRAVRVDTPVVVAHNGIIRQSHYKEAITQASNLTLHEWDFDTLTAKEKESDLSDTQQFIKSCLAPLGKLAFSSSTLRLLDLSNVGKYAFLTPERIILVGLFNEFEGCYFSNRTYELPSEKRDIWGGCTPYNDYHNRYQAARNINYRTGVGVGSLWCADLHPCEICHTSTRQLTTIGNVILCTDCAKMFPNEPKYPLNENGWQTMRGTTEVKETLKQRDKLVCGLTTKEILALDTGEFLTSPLCLNTCVEPITNEAKELGIEEYVEY